MANEIMCSLLGGGKWTINIKSLYEVDESGIQGTCHSFMAIDPDCFIGKEEFKELIDRYIDTIKASGSAEGIDEILLPGEPESKTEKSFWAEGIPLAHTTVEDLIKLSEDLGMGHPF